MTCSTCNGSRLLLGGWMGPTPSAPYPHPCPGCSPEMGKRELQEVYAAFLFAMEDSPLRRKRESMLTVAHNRAKRMEQMHGPLYAAAGDLKVYDATNWTIVPLGPPRTL